MKVLSRNGGPDLTTRAEGIELALASGRDRLDPKAVTYARTVIDRTGDRLRLGPDYTIVALVGATGSGKSSLFNALAGMELAEAGVRRPTTGRAMAVVWGEETADPLLDWLEVPRRHRTRRETVLDANREAELHGLVLLDMPDHDSTQLAHRLEVDRLVELVDLLVWVVDPQKYADEALHHGYLTRLANHDGVMIVVLNQADRLGKAELEACKRDLRRLLDSDGLSSVRILVTSAVTGEGVEDLRELLAEVVDVQGAVAARATADLERSARRLEESLAETEPDPRELSGADDLVAALAAAAGVPVVLDAVSADYRRKANAALGWPFVRWWHKVRPDPLRRLRLGEGTEDEVRSLTRSALPQATPSQKAKVELSARQLIGEVTEKLPRAWADSVRAAANRPDEDLSDELDQAVGEVDLSFQRPAWWSLVNAVQIFLALTATLGLIWLVLIGMSGFLQLPQVDTPKVGAMPLPTVMFVGGLLFGGLLTLVVRRLIDTGARRRRAQVAEEMRVAIQGVAWSHVIAPIAEVLNDHRATRLALEAAF